MAVDMVRNDWRISDVRSSELYVQLHPTWDFVESQMPRTSHGATLGGRLYTSVDTTVAYRWSLPLTFVSSADRAQVMPWWRNQTELLLTLNLSDTNRATSYVRIANQMEPLGQRSPFQIDRYSGILQLQETRGLGLLPGGLFILDDAYWGVLDEAYNVLG